MSGFWPFSPFPDRTPDNRPHCEAYLSARRNALNFTDPVNPVAVIAAARAIL